MLIRIIITTCLFTFTSLASEYALVMNTQSSIEKISLKQARDIFIMKRHFVNSVKVIPVNSAASLEIRNIFERKVLRMNRNKLNNYWIKQHFQGIQPPVVQSSLQSLKLFVKNVDGAIAYIPKGLLDNELKVLYEF